jgi:hypothetical protein
VNKHDFSALVSATVKSTADLLVVKGGEYADDADRLANFKRGAALTGATPLQVAFIYASKHYDGIASFVKTSAAGTPRPSSEPIEGRFDDLINYCILMKALVVENQEIYDLREVLGKNETSKRVDDTPSSEDRLPPTREAVRVQELPIRKG